MKHYGEDLRPEVRDLTSKLAQAHAEVDRLRAQRVYVDWAEALSRQGKAEAEVKRLRSIVVRANLILGQCERCSKGMLR